LVVGEPFQEKVSALTGAWAEAAAEENVRAMAAMAAQKKRASARRMKRDIGTPGVAE
jgi:hypothetical protein